MAVVGMTKFCKAPPNQPTAIIGGYIDPQLEAILALKPDLVVAMPSMGAQQIFDQLHKKGIPVLIGFGDSLAELRNLIHHVGLATGKSKDAQAALKRFDSGFAQLATSPRSVKTPSVLVVVGTQPLVVAGGSSFIGEILTLLKVPSVATVGTLPWPLWPLEAVLRHHPGLIIHIQGPAALVQLEKDLAPIMRHPTMRHTQLRAPQQPILQSAGVNLLQEAVILKELIEQASR